MFALTVVGWMAGGIYFQVGSSLVRARSLQEMSMPAIHAVVQTLFYSLICAALNLRRLHRLDQPG
jgi:hypothetical protein